MSSIDFLLNQPLFLLILGVFVVLVGASEAGFFAGRWVSRRFRKQGEAVPSIDNNVSTITNSSLALLALFLGFAFSSALDHFEKNREAVSNEAVAIAAVSELVNLQPEPFRTQLRSDLVAYLDLRLQVVDLPNDSQAIRQLQNNDREQQKKLWVTVGAMTRKVPEATFLQPLVDALKSMVAAETIRTESLVNGVPNGLYIPVALFLLFNGILMGVSLGEVGQRHILLSWGLYFLVALAVGIIVDLDRPFEGFINVDQQAMIILKEMLRVWHQ